MNDEFSSREGHKKSGIPSLARSFREWLCMEIPYFYLDLNSQSKQI